MSEQQSIGLDLLEIERLERALGRRPRLAERLFTAGEREYAAARARPGQHLAARFCAKEAVAKALGMTAWSFTDVEVVSDPDGVPRVALHGAVAQRAAGGVRALGPGEQALGESGTARERTLEPLDLEPIDPDARCARRRRGHSTVTVFARFRGWSTFSPR